MNGASTPPRKTNDLPSSSLLTPTPAHGHNHSHHSSSPRPSTSSASLSTAAREPISSSTLLSAHNGSAEAALEAAVQERNGLSAENRQLWKLLEKSRGAYGDAIKNLERVRGERDAYKSRLQHLGENTDAVARAFRERERKMRGGDKPTTSASVDSAASNGNGKLTPEWGMPRAIAAPPRSSSVPTTSSHGPAISITTQSPQPQPGSGGSPLSAHESPQSIRPNTHQLRHESRIELPAEAREYIQSMTESPLPSPRAPHPPAVPELDEREVTASPVPTLEIDEPEEDVEAELGTRTSIEEADTIKSRRTTESAPVSPADELPPQHSSIDIPRQRSDSRSSSQEQEQVVYSRRLPPLDTPTTPTANSYSASQSTLNTPVTAVHNGSFNTPSSALNNDIASSSSTSTNMSLTPSSSSATITSTAPSSIGTASVQAQQGTPQFRALPLLPHDLPRTKVSVTASTIRPNDRGKDVLSFVVSVDPGNGKDSWSVEKLYSDVAALDARIRAGYGRSVSKKLPHLPDGKLWRDHAPSRVDQRKAVLEAYLVALIGLPVKSNDEAIAFLTSDIVRSANRPVWRAGYKEGYLTKRGKNFGGWKTRFFVLQGPVLEYYESRGGTHLGAIPITGAQIGRQQKPQDRRETEEESEYRHAFLVIEARGASSAGATPADKARAGSGHRHVLCAESDTERDAWVDMLVRYVSGTFNDGDLSATSPPPSISLGASPSPSIMQPRSSTSSAAPEQFRSAQSGEYTRAPQTEFVRPEIPQRGPERVKPTRAMSKDDISVGPAVPLSKLAPDANNAKLFASTSSLDSGAEYTDAQNAQRILAGKSSPAGSIPEADTPLSASLPTSSPLTGAEADDILATAPRSNSELGHYPHLPPPGQQSQPSSRREKRQSYHPQLNVVPQGATPPRDPSPRPQRPVHPAAAAVAAAQAQQQQQDAAQGKVKISGPVAGSGAPIPAGYKFGAVEAPSPVQPPASQGKSDSSRREKAKSRLLWGWKTGGASDKDDKQSQASRAPPRAVFGVTLEESLDVASVVGLPAVVFRCVQYLEAKKAHEEEGIYRLSGSSSVVKALKDRFNAEGDVDLLALDEHWDLHAIAGLLKTFFRDLPSTILTSSLHMRFMRVMDYVSAEERLTELTRLIRALPLANYSLLRALSAHLILIVDNHAQNKMTMRNVGIVFSPTLGIPAGVFGLMLGAFNRVFDVDDPNGNGGNSERAEVEPVQDERRNSRQYTDAAADRLLGLAGRTLSRGASHAPRATTAAEAEVDTDTDEDNELELSVNDESGTEGTATDAEEEVAARERESRARALAAGRGLSINTADSKRASRLPGQPLIGLPSSPRPSAGAGSPFNPGFPGQGQGQGQGQGGLGASSLQVPR